MDNGNVRVTLSRGLSVGGKPIKRLEEGEKVRYTNVMLLGPGEWTDAASRTELFYAPEAIKRSASNWVDPRTGEGIEKAPLNHYHEHDVPAENVGHIAVESAHADDEGRLYADIVFHMRTQRSEEMESMMELSMEEGGSEGLGGISVEIPRDETEWDDERQMEKMSEMWFSGAGLVMNPASATVDFKNQSNRATALAGATGDRELYTRSGGETTKPRGNGQGDMGDDTPPAVRRLRELQEQAEETSRRLQNETDMALDALGTYLSQEENAREDPVSAFQAWAQDALEGDMASMVMQAIESFGAAVDGDDAAEMSVGDLMDWAESATNEGDTDGEDEGVAPDEEPEPEGELEDGMGGGVDDGSVEAVADTLESVVQTVDEAVSQLKNEVGDIEEQTEELNAKVAEVDKRLADFEDEPNTRSLAGGESPSDEDEPPETTAPSGTRTSDGYVTR